MRNHRQLESLAFFMSLLGHIPHGLAILVPNVTAYDVRSAVKQMTLSGRRCVFGDIES